MKISIPPRMKEMSLWALWVLLMGGATLWLLVGSVSYWVQHGWLPEKVEGWVQAFGSIGAILAAIWIAERGHRREDRAVSMENFRLAWLADCAAEQMCNALQNLRDDLIKSTSFGGPEGGLDAIVEAAAAFKPLMSQRLPHGLVRPVFRCVSFSAAVVGELEDAASQYHHDRGLGMATKMLAIKRWQREFQAIWASVYSEYANHAKATDFPYTQRIFQ